ncbi:asialoglycoprotein receptor 1-like [Mugil cephalus]|uniref:asialoglycoprotein receptor 1-like n=1 Tax=Mugil cephalus TaxID=48193 RepID=UPI001FB815AA|nr:asialoglycoprotein receptor 1-like [Mugil cephalus]
MIADQYEKDKDTRALWVKEPGPGVSRFRHWVFPAVTAAVVLILVLVLGVTNVKTSNRLWSVEEKVSNLSDVIQSLNASLQNTLDAAEEVRRMRFAVENNKDQLTSMSDALKQLSVVDTLTKSVTSLKCSLERIINNSSAADGCCPMDWTVFGTSCYFFSSLSLSWNESRLQCEKEQAHLVIVQQDKDWNFVTRHLAQKWFWVGLSEWRTGRWEWVNQTPYQMERRRWRPGKPSRWISSHYGFAKDCAYLDGDGRLNNMGCSTKLRYICQKHSQRT